MTYRNKKVALVVPCYNEEITIYNVITRFKTIIPEIIPYVFDNNSKDNTIKEARRAGANIISVKRKGKGNVVRRMFSAVDADIYIMVDGDNTYEAEAVHKLIDKLIDEDLDMVVGCRKVEKNIAKLAYRRGHQLGNKLLTKSVSKIFGGTFTDMLSGYRVFSKRYAKSFPALATGFEIETELTVHALALRMPYGEVQTMYIDRPEGSNSKLSTYKDGITILFTIIKLFMREKPFLFFSILGLFFVFISILLGAPIVIEFINTGIVPRLPSAVLSSAIMIIAIFCIFCGLILDSITISRHEIKYLTYLNIKD